MLTIGRLKGRVASCKASPEVRAESRRLEAGTEGEVGVAIFNNRGASNILEGASNCRK